MNTADKLLTQIKEDREIREKASRDYDTEDFNGSLLIDGHLGSYGFEMMRCDWRL